MYKVIKIYNAITNYKKNKISFVCIHNIQYKEKEKSSQNKNITDQCAIKNCAKFIYRTDENSFSPLNMF